MSTVIIIINCHNGAEFLADTLDSIKKQTYQDFEIIFFNNFSEDSSEQIAKTFDNRLHYYESKDFLSLGAARNEALKLSKGKYIAFIDCDDIWEVDKLKKQVEFLESDLTIGMVFTNFKRFNMLSGKTDIFDKKGLTKKLTFPELVGNYSFCLSSFMIRKEALNGLDHFFNIDFQYAEEFELFSRIAYNWNSLYVSEPLVIYRIHKKMTTLQVEERIGIEYGIALDNLKKLDGNIESRFPETVKKIAFLRDFTTAKYLIKFGKNKKVRQLLQPYLNYNIRALVFCSLSVLPPFLSKLIVKLLYRTRI